MNLHTKIHFEDEICRHLAANGWLYAEGDAGRYDRELALFPDDVLAWVQETQPDAWEALTKNHGGSAGQTLLDRLRDLLAGRFYPWQRVDLVESGLQVLACQRNVSSLALSERFISRKSAEAYHCA